MVTSSPPTQPGGIRQAITVIADQARTIRIPVHMIETITNSTEFRQMLQEMGQLMLEKLAERMLMPEDKIRKVLKIAKIAYSTGKRLIGHLCGRFASGSHRGYHPRAAADSATTESPPVRQTHDVLAGLTAREAKVLRMRFGIDMNTDHTLEEVDKVHVTRTIVVSDRSEGAAQTAVTGAVLKCCVAS